MGPNLNLADFQDAAVKEGTGARLEGLGKTWSEDLRGSNED